MRLALGAFGAGAAHDQLRHPAADADAALFLRRLVAFGDQHVAVRQHMQPARMVEPVGELVDGKALRGDGISPGFHGSASAWFTVGRSVGFGGGRIGSGPYWSSIATVASSRDMKTTASACNDYDRHKNEERDKQLSQSGTCRCCCAQQRNRGVSVAPSGGDPAGFIAEEALELPPLRDQHDGQRLRRAADRDDRLREGIRAQARPPRPVPTRRRSARRAPWSGFPAGSRR